MGRKERSKRGILGKCTPFTSIQHDLPKGFRRNYISAIRVYMQEQAGEKYKKA
jgi:hypothetical protein